MIIPNQHNCVFLLLYLLVWLAAFCNEHVAKQQKGGQSNQLQIIKHQLCWLGIKQAVYLACCKFTALIKLVYVLVLYAVC